MCRLAAYMGPELQLYRLLQEPTHSLLKQSWAPEELVEAKLNADGFGFGWYLPDSKPAIYTNTLPIWSDTNLAGLGQSLHSHIWLANVRSATPGQDLNQLNTQPFVYKKIMYLHNGYLKEFNNGIKQEFHRILRPDIQAGIQGNTDSEYIFALFRQNLSTETNNLESSLVKTLQMLETLLIGTMGLVNLIVCNGNELLACRHAINGGECPSLYITTDHPDYPDAVLIASERLSKPEQWQTIAKHSLVIFTSNESVRTVDL